MEWHEWLLALTGAAGVGGMLKTLLDWFLNRKGNNLKYEVDEKEALRKDIEYLRGELEALRLEVKELKDEVATLEDKQQYMASILRKWDDMYHRAVALVRDEPDTTLREKLKELMEGMQPLVNDWFKQV